MEDVAGTGAGGDQINFFTAELKSILWAEKHLLKTLPKWEKLVAGTELKTLLSKVPKSSHTKTFATPRTGQQPGTSRRKRPQLFMIRST